MSDAAQKAMFRTPAQAYDRHIGRYGRPLACALAVAAGVEHGAAGLEDIEVGSVVVLATYDDFDDLWQPLDAGSRRPGRTRLDWRPTAAPR